MKLFFSKDLISKLSNTPIRLKKITLARISRKRKKRL